MYVNANINPAARQAYEERTISHLLNWHPLSFGEKSDITFKKRIPVLFICVSKIYILVFLVAAEAKGLYTTVSSIGVYRISLRPKNSRICGYQIKREKVHAYK